MRILALELSVLENANSAIGFGSEEHASHFDPPVPQTMQSVHRLVPDRVQQLYRVLDSEIASFRRPVGKLAVNTPSHGAE